jgi:hypothetical protein
MPRSKASASPAAHRTTRTNGNSILCFGYAKPALEQRERVLRENGFHVFTVSSFRSAKSLVRKHGHQLKAMIVGHLVPESERTSLSELFKECSPRGSVIVFYRGSVKNAHDADALLAAERSSETLLETLLALD